MDVDVATDVGTSADRPGGKKRFEVKKVSNVFRCFTDFSTCR